ncbi:MAG: glycosyl transferase family 1 [Enterovirga sp.]|jgi:glycosyltransferase involved in cell wall biosynthesis|nr:glycosyl transferase family 1 [Enterovirga sp.]
MATESQGSAGKVVVGPPMRVAILADFAQASGGAQSVAIQSALALAGQGVEVTYLHGIDGPADPRLAAAGVDVVGLGQPDIWDRSLAAGLGAGIWNRDAARRLDAALRQLPAGPTVLHLHQWTRSLSPSVYPVLFRSGHPVVVTLHDYFIACPNGVYYRFERDAPCSLTPLSPACIAARCDPRSMAHKAVRVLRTAATRRALRGGPFDVVHVSDRGRDTVAPFLPPNARQHRIDNPVEVTRAAPAEIGRDAKLAYIGRLTREKGADLVAEAAGRAGMPVLFIGEGPAEAAIRQANPAAELLGWRSRSEIDQLLRCDVRAVVAPSRWYETGPLTVYEALAAGIPAVVSGRAGAAEKVLSGETGFVVEPEVDALASALGRLADIALVRRMGQAAHERYWQAPLSAERHAAALMALYESLHRGRAGAA